MFDKIGRLAEVAASNVSLSRRGFFGRFGQIALGAAGVLGGLLVLPGAAQASGAYVCCMYKTGKLSFVCGAPYYRCYPAGYGCPKSVPVAGCGYGKLARKQSVSSCQNCGVL